MAQTEHWPRHHAVLASALAISSCTCMRTAIVTGSTGGIGRAIAKVLAREKASIVVNGLGDPTKTERFRASLEAEYGVRAITIDADLSRAADAVQLIEAATAAFGHVDIL